MKDQIIAYVHSHEDELFELCSTLIKFPNENPTGSQQEIIDFVLDYLQDIDMKAGLVGNSQKFPCIYAQTGPAEGKTLLFNGHVDVVPAGDSAKWAFPPFSGEITDEKILGRGASDMKCGLAAFLFACAAIKELKLKLHGQIKLHIVSDEESGGQHGTSWLCAHGYSDNLDGVIVAEPTSKTIEIGQKGRVELTVEAHGESAHGSLAGVKGDNAILKLVRVLQKLESLQEMTGVYSIAQQTALENSLEIAAENFGDQAEKVIQHVAFNVGLISGGTRSNMVPESAKCTIDIRIPIGLDAASVKASVGAILDQEEGITYTFREVSPPNFTEYCDPLVMNVKNNAEYMWQEEILPAYQWASSDANEYRRLGIPTLQYGPSNTEGIHSYNEDVDKIDVSNAAAIFLLTIYDFLT